MSTRSAVRMIVVATDFSVNAGVALAWAVQLARQHHAGIVLVHAVRPETPAAPEFVQWSQQYADDILASAQRELDRQTETIRSRDVAVDRELGVGTAAEVILAAAERRGADLVVAGTRGHTGLKRLFLGSTAARLVRDARCPVLTVPSNAGTRRPVRTVLVPTDFSDDAALAADAAARLLGVAGADGRLVLLHAYHVASEATYLPAAVLVDAIKTADAKVKRMLEERAARLRQSGICVDTLTCEGEPPTVILRHASSVDVIAMGTQGLSGLNRLFLGSTAERVIAQAPCPVLTVPRQSA